MHHILNEKNVILAVTPPPPHEDQMVGPLQRLVVKSILTYYDDILKYIFKKLQVRKLCLQKDQFFLVPKCLFMFCVIIK